MNQSGSARERKRFEISRFPRTAVPSTRETSFVIGSALLCVLSFPNFDLWFLAWFGLAPLLVVILSSNTEARAAFAGWLWGVIFFYGSCWWLTYPMIRYAGISSWLAYPLLLLPIMMVALFPALFAGFLCRSVQRFGFPAITLAPLFWVSFEWLRYSVTGQLWNAFGYSQAFHPLLIQSARTGGVYALSFLLLTINIAVACVVLKRWQVGTGLFIVSLGLAFLFSNGSHPSSLKAQSARAAAIVVATQPNVPMDISGDSSEMNALLQRHLALTQTGLSNFDSGEP